jgi:phosphatidate phosphatase APP1
VATLYQALQRGGGEIPVNPIFYISSSPWNLHDLLIDFLRLNEIPPGPLFLRDLGLDRTKFIKEKGHGHKLEKALVLMDAYPQLPFVLIGDSGQEDPHIYSELIRQRPGRILSVYIRDVDPDADSRRDDSTRRAVGLAEAAGVPMILAPNSLSISEHARHIGLISKSAIGEVADGVEADQSLPETGEQALQDALDSVFPTDK